MEHSVNTYFILFFSFQVKLPVLFPLVNAGDQSHLAVPLGSPVCD